MKKILLLLLIGAPVSNVLAQSLHLSTMNSFLNSAFEQQSQPIIKSNIIPSKTVSSFVIGGIAQIMQAEKFNFEISPNTVTHGDTLIVGFTAKDTLFVTGTWNHSGPILVMNDGVVIFKNANANILGDLLIVGYGKVFADSSLLNFPQQFFYQRTILVFQHGYLNFSNTKLNYGGFTHNFTVSDSGVVVMNNVTQTDFTTTGLSGNGSISINGCNLTGEFIIMDNVNLQLQNVQQALLWHHFPSTAVINHNFPSGDSLSSYTFNNSTVGVSGIDYNIQVNNSTHIEWGMMPLGGSDITVSDSKIRAIGLWFTGNDSSSVSGLVDNASYPDFTAPLNDRNLHIKNSSVTTWSLYIFDSKKLYIKGCILGEVGSFGISKITGENYWVDGSGGYCFSSDSSFYFNANVVVSSAVRSERNSFFVFAYSTQTVGVPTAIGQSVLVVAQSVIPQDPIAFDRSAVWLANIAQPVIGNINTDISIIGSAWIDKTKASPLMDFAQYKVDFQKEGDIVWTSLTGNITNEVRNGTLATWDTRTLATGNYILRLTLSDTWGNHVEAKKTVNLQSGALSTDLLAFDTKLRIYPNPFSEQTVIQTTSVLNDATLLVSDIFGKNIVRISGIVGQTITLNREDLPAGIYFIRLVQDNQVLADAKIVVCD